MELFLSCPIRLDPREFKGWLLLYALNNGHNNIILDTRQLFNTAKVHLGYTTFFKLKKLLALRHEINDNMRNYF